MPVIDPVEQDFEGISCLPCLFFPADQPEAEEDELVEEYELLLAFRVAGTGRWHFVDGSCDVVLRV